MKIQKKKLLGGLGGSGLGVRVDVNEELKFLGKLRKKWGGGVRGEGDRGSGWGGGGQGGCEQRIEDFCEN